MSGENIQKTPLNFGTRTQVNVCIAGSGPIAAAYARIILEKICDKNLKVLMIEIGAQEGPRVGVHQNNAIRYQKEADAPIIESPSHAETTLGGDEWKGLVPEMAVYLKGYAMTRTVGGMATHWTCACPLPDEEEIKENPIEKSELTGLLKQASKLLNVHDDQFDSSIRQEAIKKVLIHEFPKRTVQNLRLAVERRLDNPDYVTWSGVDTIFGNNLNDSRFELWQETRVTSLHSTSSKKINYAKVQRLSTQKDVDITADVFIIACGAIGTPQILTNSPITVPNSLGRYLCEHSIAFSQIVLKINDITTAPEFAARVEAHSKAHPNGPMTFPSNDPKPQIAIRYEPKLPWHIQIQGNPFSYGADPSGVIDLRSFTKQDINPDNKVSFDPNAIDAYGMPQPKIHVKKSQGDETRGQNMVDDMDKIAQVLGTYLPGTKPELLKPGLAHHITGTTRIGKDVATSVADPSSRVHGWDNLWVGGNGCTPDSTSCNPTLISLAIALKGADSVVDYLKKLSSS